MAEEAEIAEHKHTSSVWRKSTLTVLCLWSAAISFQRSGFKCDFISYHFNWFALIFLHFCPWLKTLLLSQIWWLRRNWSHLFPVNQLMQLWHQRLRHLFMKNRLPPRKNTSTEKSLSDNSRPGFMHMNCHDKQWRQWNSNLFVEPRETPRSSCSPCAKVQLAKLQEPCNLVVTNPWCEKIKRSQQLTTISLFHLFSIPDLCIHATATNLRNRPLPIYGTASDRWKNKSFLLKHPRNRSISGFRTWFCRDQVWASTPQNRRRIDPNFCMTTTCKSWWIAAWLLTTVCKTLENKQKASGLHECKKPLWKKSWGAFFDWIIFL